MKDLIQHCPICHEKLVSEAQFLSCPTQEHNKLWWLSVIDDTLHSFQIRTDKYHVSIWYFNQTTELQSVIPDNKRFKLIHKLPYCLDAIDILTSPNIENTIETLISFS